MVDADASDRHLHARLRIPLIRSAVDRATDARHAGRSGRAGRRHVLRARRRRRVRRPRQAHAHWVVVDVDVGRDRGREIVTRAVVIGGIARPHHQRHRCARRHRGGVDRLRERTRRTLMPGDLTLRLVERLRNAGPAEARSQLAGPARPVRRERDRPGAPNPSGGCAQAPGRYGYGRPGLLRSLDLEPQDADLTWLGSSVARAPAADDLPTEIRREQRRRAVAHLPLRRPALHRPASRTRRPSPCSELTP